MQKPSNHRQKIIIIFVLIITSYVFIYKQVAALECINEPDQHAVIDRELSQYWLNLENKLQGKDQIQLFLRYQGNVQSKHQQKDLLQELIISQVVCHQSSQLMVDTAYSLRNNNKFQGNDVELLNELLVEASN